jgi:Flp pilus assembly protein TadB
MAEIDHVPRRGGEMDRIVVFGETSLTEVLGAIGIFIGAVATALFGWWIKVQSNRSRILKEQKETDAEIERKAKAEQRRQERNTNKELYEILDVQKKDREEDRELIHALRSDMQVITSRLEYCEYDREHLRMRSEDQETALLKAGIHVHYRAMPKFKPNTQEGQIKPHGPNESGGG